MPACLYLDVGAGELVLHLHELLEVHVLGELHARRVDREDLAPRPLVRHREFDLPVDAPGPDERRVQRLDAVRGHYHLSRATSNIQVTLCIH